jgi:hypothetical protein
MVWFPWVKVGVDIVLFTARISMGSALSMKSAALVVPHMAEKEMLAVVPVKAKETPVLGHVSSLVAGFTRPT